MTLDTIQDDILDEAGQIPSLRRNAVRRKADVLRLAGAPDPSESWWVGVDRREFIRRASDRQESMAQSKFGKTPSSFLAERS